MNNKPWEIAMEIKKLININQKYLKFKINEGNNC